MAPGNWPRIGIFGVLWEKKVWGFQELAMFDGNVKVGLFETLGKLATGKYTCLMDRN